MIASEYIEVENPTLFAATTKMTYYITIATTLTSSSHFGDQYQYAIALRAMHMNAVNTERPNGDSGLITNKREGNASVSFKHKEDKGSHSDLSMTQYGKRLSALGRSQMPSISVVGDPDGIITQIMET